MISPLFVLSNPEATKVVIKRNPKELFDKQKITGEQKDNISRFYKSRSTNNNKQLLKKED